MRLPQFPARRTQPMRPESYTRVARLLRQFADRLEAAASADDPIKRRALTMALNSLAHAARGWRDRHRATINGTLTMPPDERFTGLEREP